MNQRRKAGREHARGHELARRQATAGTDSPAGMRFGLALGGGAARGWSHIGVLRVLLREGLRPSVIAGSSIGAVVGGCYAAGKLDELEEFARSLTTRRVVGLLDFHLNGSGLLAGDRLQKLLLEHLGELGIEDLPLRFAAVATELGSGHEIWMTRGPLAEALRASYALPGVFDAVALDGRWLMDGALVNPIPVNAARVLGAEAILAVNLNGQLRGRAAIAHAAGSDIDDEPGDGTEEANDNLLRRFFQPLQNAIPGGRGQSQRPRPPGLGTVLMDVLNITQDRIARSRLAGDPPDVMVTPRLSDVGLFDFHRAADIIALGEKAMERTLPDLLEYLTGDDGNSVD
ncbi:patatin-like phospholipase family protein [Pseudochelatococcus contaminans]|uniref:NTE family protein n=1 Tax=Pseudochelatococcus contaminans TaxID=1538103 RepID=A0A7W5Z1V6_9HYPH|nr:patatin-like phospholipase family protein [Pseudochelatococcus contaminans]MBB3808453.1 NTE family protein [Pseudochelatococcus contaminans]